MSEHERMNYWWRRAKKAEAGLVEAWDRGYETGVETNYGSAEPGGQPYEPDSNPYGR